jgi:AcrR family transcriptional regulator
MGAKTPKTSDRRVEKTHRALREALIALIAERGWDAFGVQELCERANVGRSTFYLHFADKEDLLDGGIEQLRAGLRSQVPRGAPARPLAFALPMIEHAWENRRAFRALLGKGSGQAILRRFRELVVELVRDDLADLSAPEPRRAASTHFLAGGFLELLTWGLESGATAGPDELERLFQSLASPVLDALKRPRP